MKKYFLIIASIYISIPALFSQSVYSPLNPDYMYLIDRYEIKSANDVGNRVFLSSKPFLRKDVAQLADTLLTSDSVRLSSVDKFNLNYLRDDNWEWSKSDDAGNSNKTFLRRYYEKKNAFYHFKSKDFEVQFNPVAYLSYGLQNANSTSIPISLNTKGIEVRGAINKRIGFYTFMTDNQAVFPYYVNEKVKRMNNSLPGEGFWKTFKENGYDYFAIRGYLTFNITKNINTQFGHDKNFIGNGYRSLMLSDFSNNYLFLKNNVNVWKLQYTMIFAKMVAENLGGNIGDVYYPSKYMALHYLSFNFSKRFTVGIFESIIFGNKDSLHERGFDANYLNPIIFYKGVENSLGAPDKAKVGLDWKWNFLKHFSHYGNIVLDEFVLHEVISRNGWWGNKQVLQLGLKYIDVAGVNNLDMQLETNIVRPYTYSFYSFSKSTNYAYYGNYSNYDQPLAHPNGANFYEFIGILRYQPAKKLSLTGKLFYTVIGLDEPGKNWGSNILLNYTTRQMDYGNSIAQGIRTQIFYYDLTASYQLKHNLFVDAKAVIRNQQSELAAYSYTNNIFSLSIRWNIAQKLNEY